MISPIINIKNLHDCFTKNEKKTRYDAHFSILLSYFLVFERILFLRDKIAYDWRACKSGKNASDVTAIFFVPHVYY